LTDHQSNSGTWFVYTGATGSGAGSNGNGNLSISDQYESSTVNINTNIIFYADYFNSTNASEHIGPTATSGCWIEFDDAWGTLVNMSNWNGSHYSYTKTGGFSTAATHYWNVSCNSTGAFSSVSDLQDDVSVINPSVPEFSDLGWIIAAVLGAGGFILVRKRKPF